MHIPDGLMWPIIMAIGWGVAIFALAIAVRKEKTTMTNEKVPTMAVLAAGIFVAQMLNFPIVGGTTGHLLGATLATLVVGPWAAIIVMSIVIIIQGFLFGDGGILAMGLNLVNMAVVAVAVSAIVLRFTRKIKTEASVFSAAWCSVFVASVVCGLELAVSDMMAPGHYGITWTVSIPMMAGLYSIIAIGEALITISIATYFLRVYPALIQNARRAPEVAT